MGKTEGEYELVLGNRQLLSAFFIVVILFALFFTMGYIVGRNSAPSTMASLPPALSTTASAKPPAMASPTPPSEPAAEAEKPAEPPAETEKPAPPIREPEPKKARSKEAPPKQAALPKPVPVKETPVKQPPPKAAAPVETAAAVESSAGRTYLQVMATGQPQAGAVVETLKQKGFPARLGQGPTATIFRVLVGPYADAAALGKAKSDLENAGFHPIVRR